MKSSAASDPLAAYYVTREPFYQVRGDEFALFDAANTRRIPESRPSPKTAVAGNGNSPRPALRQFGVRTTRLGDAPDTRPTVDA